MGADINGSYGYTPGRISEHPINIFCVTKKDGPPDIEYLVKEAEAVKSILSNAGYDVRLDRSCHYFGGKAPILKKILWNLWDIFDERGNYLRGIKSRDEIERFMLSEMASKGTPTIYVSGLQTQTAAGYSIVVYSSPEVPDVLWISPIGMHREFGEMELKESLYSFAGKLEKSKL